MPRPRIVLGTMTFGGQTSLADATEMVELFAASPLAAPQAELDTASMYVGGETERLLGKLLLASAASGVVSVASKANPFGASSLSVVGTAAQCEESLAALRLPCLDLFYLHAPDPDVPIEETLAQHAPTTCRTPTVQFETWI